MQNELRSLPSVDKILKLGQISDLNKLYGLTLVTNTVRKILEEVRIKFHGGKSIPKIDEIVNLVENELNNLINPTLMPVINATGVVLHTNLGRAPLSATSIEALSAVANSYSALEYDLEKGTRGSRSIHAEKLLKIITGAEGGYAVNNNASAVLLTLTALAKGKRVIISRTQLVEIGGGFRIPDVMKQSGAKLVEIGTTNRVNLDDYRNAISDGAELVMIAHHSNFKLVGFTDEPAINEIVQLAHLHNIKVINDIGSGALVETEKYGLPHEPTVQESIKDGVDLVLFSGDKLLGGPQSGIIVGKANLLAKLKKHPLARAVRADKLCLAALSATLLHYVKDEVNNNVPVWIMISQSQENLRKRVNKWISQLKTGEIHKGYSTIGGGSLPEETLPTSLLALRVKHPDRTLNNLRRSLPPIIARVEKGLIMIDPRTVLPYQDDVLISGLKLVLENEQ